MVPFSFMEDRYEFYDDDHYDGAAVMTIRGRRLRLEEIFIMESDAKKED